MMTASREITVYSSDGLNRIGVLQRGEEVLTLGDTGAGTVVAYIIGLVKNEDKAALLTQDEWEKAGTAADRLCAFAQAQVDNGSIYVLGAQGQTGGEITEAWIKMREHNDTANTKRAVALWKKRLAAGYAGLRAFDCSGLVIRHLLDEKLISGDKNANGIYYDLCDPIDKTALSAGDLVFKKYLTNSRMYHVGVYMGDNTVVHAKGRDDGVVREAISKTGWSRFGRLRCFGGAAAQAGYYRLLKNTGKPYMSGADVTAAQAALETKGFSPGGVDGVYGPATEAAVKAFQSANGLETDGIAGPITWAALVG